MSIVGETNAAVKCFLNIVRHCGLFLLRPAPLLKPQQNQYVGMAMPHCRFKMMLDSGGYVGLLMKENRKSPSHTEIGSTRDNVRRKMEMECNKAFTLRHH